MSGGLAYEKLLDRVFADFSENLVFAGILDNKAKLLSYRKGNASFAILSDRYDTLDVQISLMFALIRQLEDITGAHRFTISHFAKCDIFMVGMADLRLFAIATAGHGERVASGLLQLTDLSWQEKIMPKVEAQVQAQVPKRQDLTDGKIQNQNQVALLKKAKPEAILMLKGYLRGLDGRYEVEESGDSDGQFLIKAKGNDQLNWADLEKLNSLFRDIISIHDICVDERDKRAAVRILPKFVNIEESM
jgi:hypothetical protein